MFQAQKKFYLNIGLSLVEVLLALSLLSLVVYFLLTATSQSKLANKDLLEKTHIYATVLSALTQVQLSPGQFPTIEKGNTLASFIQCYDQSGRLLPWEQHLTSIAWFDPNNPQAPLNPNICQDDSNPQAPINQTSYVLKVTPSAQTPGRFLIQIWDKKTSSWRYQNEWQL